MRWRWLRLVALYLFLLIGGAYAGHALVELVAFDIQPQNEAKAHAMIMTATGAFILASATPFVPGAEIGFALLLLLGSRIAVLVYLSMLAALLLSYLIGRFVPAAVIAALFGHAGLDRARALVLRLAPLGPADRLDFLTAAAPRRVIPVLLRHRYLALIVLFNLPGNSVIGGGGGIAFTAGLSGLFSLPGYLAAVMVAVLPVPLFFLVSGLFG